MMFRTAPAPTKANNSFLLSLGMVNIPLAVLSGHESTRVERKEFFQGDVDKPIGRQAFNKADGTAVEPADVTRMALSSTGAWVLLSDDEIAEATMPKGVAEVVAFVPVNKIAANYVTSKVDQVRARTTGLNKPQAGAAEHAYGLFLAGLRARKVAALVQVALRGPAQYALITADGDLQWVYPADGIRQPKPMNPVVLQDRELDLMGQLIDSYPKGAPVITDTTAEAVQAFVDAKAALNGATPTVTEPAEAVQSDLFAALTASIEAKKAGAA
jgi:non-homologous end joining protein Ku